jgi:hypothetical protein
MVWHGNNLNGVVSVSLQCVFDVAVSKELIGFDVLH